MSVNLTVQNIIKTLCYSPSRFKIVHKQKKASNPQLAIEHSKKLILKLKNDETPIYFDLINIQK